LTAVGLWPPRTRKKNKEQETMKTVLTAALLMMTSLALAEGPPAGADRYGHAPDYTWVQGELIHRDLKAGLWQLRYIPEGQEAENDPHQGLCILANPPELKGFFSGQFVKITGQISEQQQSIQMAGAMYALKTVERLEVAPTPRPAPPELTAEQLETLKKLVADLGADAFEARAAAEKGILEIGPGALPHVQPLVTSEDTEVAERAGRIVKQFEETLGLNYSPISVKLSTNKDKYAVGEKVHLLITVTNEGEQPVILIDSPNTIAPWTATAAFMVFDAEGNRIESIDRGSVGMIRSRHRALSIAPPGTHEVPTWMDLMANALVGDAAAGAEGAPKAAAHLVPNEKIRCFVLPKPGKYTLKFVLTDKLAGSVPASEKAPEAGTEQPTPQFAHCGVLGRPDVSRSDHPALRDMVPLVGAFESNSVTFEVIK
jgi:hypothetical protein